MLSSHRRPSWSFWDICLIVHLLTELLCLLLASVTSAESTRRQSLISTGHWQL
jgi:hypothetical protein